MKNIDFSSDGDSSGSNLAASSRAASSSQRVIPRSKSGKNFYNNKKENTENDKNSAVRVSPPAAFNKLKISPPTAFSKPKNYESDLQPDEPKAATNTTMATASNEKKKAHHKTSSFDFQLQKAKRNSMLSIVDHRKSLVADSKQQQISSTSSMEEELIGAITSSLDEFDPKNPTGGIFSLRSIYGQKKDKDKTQQNRSTGDMSGVLALSPDQQASLDSDSELDWRLEDESEVGDTGSRLKNANRTVSFGSALNMSSHTPDPLNSTTSDVTGEIYTLYIPCPLSYPIHIKPPYTLHTLYLPM